MKINCSELSTKNVDNKTWHDYNSDNKTWQRRKIWIEMRY